MCGILCFKSSQSHDLDNLCLFLKHRGPDHSDITTFELNNDSKINFIVTQLMIVGKELFPIMTASNISERTDRKNLVIGNIEIYNFKELYHQYLKNDFIWDEWYSDAHIILPLFNKLGEKTSSIIQTFEKLLDLIQGDYALVLFIDQTHLLVARDSVGIRPLYYANDSNYDLAFASEVASLTQLGYSLNQIKTVKPGTFSVIEINEQIKGVEWFEMNNNLTKICNLRLDQNNINNQEINTLVEELSKLLIDSVKKLLPTNQFILFLSGGIDSSILLGILLHLKQKENFKVISVGFKDSSDLMNAQKLCKEMGIELESVIITKDDIEDALKSVVPLIKSRTGTINTMDISIALPVFFASKKAQELDCKVALTGQGADELFIGYNKYFEEDVIINRRELLEKINSDIIHIASQNLERDDLVSMHFSIELRFPYLDMKLIKWISGLDLSILTNENNSNRKDLLRKAATKLDLPDYIVTRPKKAAQYGSLIMKNLYSLAKPFNSVTEYLNSFI